VIDVPKLTQREKDVLELVGKGMTNKEIARMLFVSHALVRLYMSRLLEKFDASNRTELVVNAFRSGILDVRD